MLSKWLTRIKPKTAATQEVAGTVVATPVSEKAQASVVVHSAPRPAASDAYVGVAKPVYPPVDGGVAVYAPDDLLAANADLMERLRLHAATTPEIFESRFKAPIRRLAEAVNSLPASSSSIFSGEGGLFRASLELAFLTYQAADGRIFTGNETVERRHALEPRWRYVCFLGALLYPVGKPLTNIIATDAQGEVWKRHQNSLTEWANERGAERLYASWARELSDEEAVGPGTYSTSLVATVAGPVNLQWLEDGSHELVQSVYEIIAGQRSGARHAQTVIEGTWKRVKEREAARRPQAYGRVTVGTQIGPHFVGALRELVSSGRWKINGDQIRADANSLYLLWPEAGEGLVSYGREMGIVGWPADPATIAEMLKGAKIVTVTHGDDMGFSEVVNADGVIVNALKLANPLSIVEDFDGAKYQGTPTSVQEMLDKDPIHQAQLKAAAAQEVAASGGDKVEIARTQHEANAVSATGTPDIPMNEGADGYADEDATEEGGVAAEEEDALDHSGDASGEAGGQANQSASEGKTKPGEIAEPRAGVRYRDLVPEEVRRDVKNVMRQEMLGQLIMKWRGRGKDSTVMRMTDDGAAIEMDFLATITGPNQSAVTWINDMAAAGLIYTHPSTPAKKVYNVAMPEGTKGRGAVILSSYAVRKLGL